MPLKKKVAPKRAVPKKKKRIILGTGYPWYSSLGDGDLSKRSGPHEVRLYVECHGRGDLMELNIRDSGAWGKYRLVLEKV